MAMTASTPASARFAATERRQPESGQPGLQIVQIMLAKGEVVKKILYAAAGLRASLNDGLVEFLLHLLARFEKFLESGEKGC